MYNIQSHFNFDTVAEIICNILTNCENETCLQIELRKFNNDISITAIDKIPELLSTSCKIFTKEQFSLNAFRHIEQNSYRSIETIYVQL